MNILTFDIEDWWVYDYYKLGNPKDYISRLDLYLDRILALLEGKGYQATFFCLGEVAAKYPNVIRKIANHGHHIGSHSHGHRFLKGLSYKEVSDDTKKSIRTIEDIIGEKVTAYRAPAFSISKENEWVLEILAENGITHDSSIFPAKRSFGGFSEFESKQPAIISYNGTKIKEFPISTAHIFGKELAYSGGGYFRLFPYWKIKKIVTNEDYLMTYFHIKDFDKEQKREFSSFHGESALSRYMKNYYGLNRNFNKFSKFMSDFDFMSLKQADDTINWGKAPLICL